MYFVSVTAASADVNVLLHRINPRGRARVIRIIISLDSEDTTVEVGDERRRGELRFAIGSAAISSRGERDGARGRAAE